MSDILYISKASQFHWRYETGPGTIHQSEVLDGNYLNEDLPTNEQTRCVDQVCNFVQCWDCSDVPLIKFTWNAALKVPWLFMYNADGSLVGFWEDSQMTNSGNEWEIGFLLSKFTCPGCYYLEIRGITQTESPVNLFTSANNGDCEALPINILPGGIGPPNSVGYSGATWVSPVTSLYTMAPADPDLDNRLAWHDQVPLTLVTGGIYLALAWVQMDLANSFVIGGQVKFNITHDGSYTSNPAVYKGWTDATILAETVYDYVIDGEGVWVQIATQFMVNTIVTGYIAISSTDIPVGSAVMFTDDIQILQGYSSVVEATTEDFQTSDNCNCHTFVQYGPATGAEHPQFGFFFDPVVFINYLVVRLPINWGQFYMRDGKYEAKDDSIGTAKNGVSKQEKIYKCWTDEIPWWLMEAIPMIMKFDTVTLGPYRSEERR